MDRAELLGDAVDLSRAKAGRCVGSLSYVESMLTGGISLDLYLRARIVR